VRSHAQRRPFDRTIKAVCRRNGINFCIAPDWQCLGQGCPKRRQSPGKRRREDRTFLQIGKRVTPLCKVAKGDFSVRLPSREDGASAGRHRIGFEGYGGRIDTCPGKRLTH
jgi:hypothetical protein